MRSLFLILCMSATAAAAEFPLGIHTFTVPDGFTVEQVAAGPLVERPINMAFDEAGALYVTDSSGSNEKPEQQLKNPTHRVVRLVDKDGDGRFDERTVFADKLSFSAGTMWLDGSLYVAAPPVIWKLTDTDADGVADKREVWFDGKTLTGCANDLHGPYAGPDGFIYWCKGAFAEQRHRLADGRDFITRASHLFRARPDGSGREVVITGGMDNPVDVVFSPTGERFLSGTFFLEPAGGQRDGILHAVHGGVWGKDHGVLQGHARTGGLMPVMTHLGPAAASGLEIARSGALGMRGELLCTQFNMRKVSRHALAADGATFRTTDRDLLVSDQADFHPTDVIEDADGSVLIADTGGWYKLCCPTSKSEKPEVLGAIYRVRKKDAAPVADPRGAKLAWKEIRAPELLARVADPRPEVAARALAHLVRLRAIPELASEASGAHPAALRLSALWGLIRIDGGEARQAVRAALSDPDSTIQTLAAYGTGLWRDRPAKTELVRLLASGDAQVRRAATEALGRIGDRSAVAPLLATAAADRFAFHAAAYALYEIADPAGLTPDAPGFAGEVSRTTLAMLSLPKPAMSPALPLIAPAAPPAPAMRRQQLARLDELAALTKNGEAKRGAEIFRGTKAACMTCHAIAREGGTFGSDLTKIGSIRTARDLMEAIAFPSSSYVRSYEPLLVRTRAGAEHFGILKNESQDAITLATSAATEVRIPRVEVAAMTEGPASLMPPGFDGLLSPQEIADLLAFLQTLRQP